MGLPVIKHKPTSTSQCNLCHLMACRWTAIGKLVNQSWRFESNYGEFGADLDKFLLAVVVTTGIAKILFFIKLD